MKPHLRSQGRRSHFSRTHSLSDFFLCVGGMLFVAVALGVTFNAPPFPAWIDLSIVAGGITSLCGLVYRFIDIAADRRRAP